MNFYNLFIHFVEFPLMSTPTVIEMIEAVIAKYGQEQAFKLMDIDKTSYYNYKKGGNTNKKKLAKIKAAFDRISTEVKPAGGSVVNEEQAEYIRNHPIKNSGKTPELWEELRESQHARIILLEEKVQSESRLARVEATLNIIAGILSDLKDQGLLGKPSVQESIGEIQIQDANKSGSNARKGTRT